MAPAPSAESAAPLDLGETALLLEWESQWEVQRQRVAEEHRQQVQQREQEGEGVAVDGLEARGRAEQSNGQPHAMADSDDGIGAELNALLSDDWEGQQSIASSAGDAAASQRRRKQGQRPPRSSATTSSSTPLPTNSPFALLSALFCAVRVRVAPMRLSSAAAPMPPCPSFQRRRAAPLPHRPGQSLTASTCPTSASW